MDTFLVSAKRENVHQKQKSYKLLPLKTWVDWISIEKKHRNLKNVYFEEKSSKVKDILGLCFMITFHNSAPENRN